MGTTTIHPEWAEAPIVRYALDKAGEGADALTVLETLHEMMTDLEERAPGVPFGEIFRCFDPASAARGRQAARRLLEEAGTDPELVDMIFTHHSLRIEEREEFQGVVDMTVAGMSTTAIADRLGVSGSFVRRARARAGIVATNARNKPYTINDWTDEQFQTIKNLYLDDPRMCAMRAERLTGFPRRMIAAMEALLIEDGLLEAVQRTQGRPASVTYEQVMQFRRQNPGATVAEQARQLGVSRRTINNVVQRGW